MLDVKVIADALALPFPPGVVKYRPGTAPGGRAAALAYVDVGTVQDRLDEVLGVGGWRDAYETLPGGSVVCRLSVCVGGDEWVTKEDVGCPSGEPGEAGVRAAHADALKRAAVKFGVGRYLYSLKSRLVEYDPAAGRIVGPPEVATPPAPPVEERVARYEAELVARGLCEPGLLALQMEARLGAGWRSEPAERVGAECRAAREYLARWANKSREQNTNGRAA